MNTILECLDKLDEKYDNKIDNLSNKLDDVINNLNNLNREVGELNTKVDDIKKKSFKSRYLIIITVIMTTIAVGIILKNMF